MDPLTLVFALGGGAVGAGLVLIRVAGSRGARRTRRALRRARVVPIAELVDGQLACISGRVELDPGAQLVESLVTRRPCVAFDTITRPFLANQMMTMERTTRRMTPFYVVDATGRARIDAPEVALCNLPIAKGETYEERILEAGAQVRIVGAVSLDPTMQTAGAEKLFRSGAFTARITGTAKYPLLADVYDR